MHELFLISDCEDEDVLKACRLLQGFCEMAPVTIINRRLVWEAPHLPKQKGIDPRFLKRPQPLERAKLWENLQEGITRQAYYVNLVYGVSRDQFGGLDAPDDPAEGPRPTLDDTPGTVYWADWPDPKSAKGVNSRTAVSIDQERGLCSLMRSMGYKLNKEIIEEGYRFIVGNVIIFLHRYLDAQPTVKDEVTLPPQPNFSTVLPSYDSLLPFDSENKWIIKARVDVQNANDQELVQKGIDELLAFREAFEGYFEFPVLERRMLDTRVRL